MNNQLLTINHSIEINKSTNINNLISEIISNFQSSSLNQIIKIKAKDISITKGVLISEVVKSRLQNIHQLLKIGSIDSISNDNSQSINSLIPYIEIYLSNSNLLETFIDFPYFEGFCYSKPYSMKELYKLNTIKSYSYSQKVQKQIIRNSIKERFSYGKEMKKKRVIYGRIYCREMILNMIKKRQG